jgi:cysteine desulfurase/selenocysteine lyase
LLRKRARLVPALQSKGYSVLQADDPPEVSSGIVSFYKPGEDLTELHKKLSDGDIITSLRVDRSGQKYIRLSPHFYNADAELDHVIREI